MKAFTIIMKILAAAAAVVGAVYVAATYGDKIVAWAKKMLPCCPACEETEEAPAVEEEAVEEAPVVEEETVEEVVEEEEEAPKKTVKKTVKKKSE